MKEYTKWAHASKDWANGEITLDEANKVLELFGVPHLDINKNKITEEEENGAVVSDDVNKVNGYGYLDMGIGSNEKILIVNGVSQNGGVSNGYVIIGGAKYRIEGEKLVERIK